MNLDDLPEMITRQQAAALCGLTYGSFGTWMAKGKVPKAAPGTRRWSKRALIAALDKMGGIERPDAANDNTKSAVEDWFKGSGYEGVA